VRSSLANARKRLSEAALGHSLRQFAALANHALIVKSRITTAFDMY